MQPQQAESENGVRCWASTAVTTEGWVPAKGKPQIYILSWEDAWNEVQRGKNQSQALLPRACLTPGLAGYGMDFSVNKGRDQSHKETVQRELVTCTITGKGLRPATGKHKGPQLRGPK